MKPYEIILADDHHLFRSLMRKSIEAIADFKVVGEASTGLELLDLLKTCKPDMIILDISMPDLRGIEAAREIKRTYPLIKILILTMHKTKNHLRSALAAGVDGYLLKENAYDDLLAAIRNLQQGRLYISTLVLTQVREIILSKENWRHPDSLTARENVILRFIGEGKSSKEIADLLFISVPTVNRHRFNIKHKLSLKSNADLIKYALEHSDSPVI